MDYISHPSLFRFGRLAKGGTRVAYVKFVDRKVLKTITNQLRSMKSMPSPHSYPEGSVLDAYHKQITQQYQETRSDLRKEAEDAFNAYEEEQNVLSFFNVDE